MVSTADILNAGILIVDDQYANVQLLEQMLSGAGYTRITSTTDPYAVCALHRDNRYDLILLDLQMPGMDGFQVMEGLKAIETNSYVPVLVITAQPSHKQRALEAGAKDFISKPFDLVEAKTRIQNMLEVRLLYKRMENYNKVLEKAVQERTEKLLKANEKLLLEIEQRKELVSDLSHQLRTPLTSMRGAVELAMKKARSGEEYQSILESNLAEIDRITALVNTMLAMAKLDGNIESLRYSLCDPVKLLNETIEELLPLWEEKSIHFSYFFFFTQPVKEFRAGIAILPQLPKDIFGSFFVDLDAFRFKQVIINILDNAYKYTPDNGLINIELHSEGTGDTETCRIVIMNNGPAIPASVLPHLFTRFFHVDVPLQPNKKPAAGVLEVKTRGFGLGLSICRKIVEMHRGKIRAFNPASGGAAFEIIIPVRQVETSADNLEKTAR